MSRNTPPIERRRVGASVVIDGQIAPVVNQYPAYIPPIGIPNPCGCPCPPPFFPPIVAPLPPPIPPPFWNGYPPYPGPNPPFPGPIPPPNTGVSLTVGIATQTIIAGGTTTLLLTGSTSSIGGGRVSGSSIILPREGTYDVSLNVTASRISTSTGGLVSFILNGGSSTNSNIAFGNLVAGGTNVFSGTATVRVSSQGTISIIVNNEGGALQILGGTISIQLVSF